MIGMTIIEVAIGLALLYLVLSTLCSAVYEQVAGMLATRSKVLEQAIRNLLSDTSEEGLAASFYAHPLIRGLSPGGKAGSGGAPRKPSYVPGRLFALALLDTIVPPEGAAERTPDDLRKALAATRESQVPPELRRVLLLHLDAAQSKLDATVRNLEVWFDDAMDRLSGTYKRHAQKIIAVLALVVTVALNVDSLLVATTLWRDPTRRAVLVAAADDRARRGADPDSAAAPDLAAIRAELETLDLPILWPAAAPGDGPRDPRAPPGDVAGWLARLFGWLVTVAAISLGAPFWFEAVNRLVNLRASGRPPRKGAGAAGG